MIINHNLGSMNALRMLSNVQGQQQSALEKLSSGQRINKAGDDAAGLAISQKMQGQINGLDQASRNAQDGISLIQTAEGALNETQSILQRMRQLSVQAANDTNTTDDRNAMQQEVNQLTSEIDRIGNSTEFNTKKLLNGQAGIAATAQTGSVAAATDISISGTNPAGTSLTAAELSSAISGVNAGAETSAGVYQVKVTATAQSASLNDGGASAANASVAADTSITVNGTTISLKATDTESDIISKINNLSSQTGVQAVDQGATKGISLVSTNVGSDAKISVTGSNADLKSLGLTSSTTATSLSAAGTDATGTINGQTASGNGNVLTLNKNGDAANGLSVNISNNLSVAAGKNLTFNAVIDSSNVVNLQIGANNATEQTMGISIDDMRSAALKVDNLDLTTTNGAKNAITSIDNAIKSVSTERAKLGAYQNRLEHTINNLGTSSQNLTAAESSITDVDMAKEMTEFSKDNILSQAGVSMLAQANQQPQLVLKLLG